MAETTEFDTERFKEILSHFDNSNANERGNAIRQALKMCADNDPPLLFWEAAEMAFGQGSNYDDELNELRGREKANADYVQEAAAKCHELQDEIDRLTASEEKPSKESWRMPTNIKGQLLKFVIAFFIGTMALVMAVSIAAALIDSGYYGPLILVVFLGAIILLFFLWRKAKTT